MKKKKDFLSIADLTSSQLKAIFMLALKLKKEIQKEGKNDLVMAHKTLVLIFEKPSLRTRLSFETGMTQLGGHAVYLGPTEIGLGVRESIQDVAGVASSMGNIIMARTYSHKTVENLSKFSNVPLINGLSDLEHPCQSLADFLTILEHFGSFHRLTLAYVGDGENNVTHSLCLGAALLGMTFKCASPIGYWMNKNIVVKALEIAKVTGAKIIQTKEPKSAVEKANIVYTDTWISMGDESEKAERLNVFQSYQITKNLMDFAQKDAIFMHDMPIHRGQEVSSEIVDGSASVIYQQAENRLHVQKALILFLMGISI